METDTMTLSETRFISGPAPKLDLVYSDVWLPGIYSRRILSFELPHNSSHERALDCLHRGLQSLVDGTPELGGLVVALPVDDEANNEDVPWKTIKPYKGVEFRIKDLRNEIPSYKELESKGFPVAAYKDDFLVPVPVMFQAEPNAVMIVQASLIEGGLLFTVCLCHSLTDGNGMNAITIALAKQCKLAAQAEGPLEPRAMNMDRKVMVELTGDKKNLSDHPAYGRVEGAFKPKIATEEAPSDEENGTKELLKDSVIMEDEPEKQASTAPPPPQVHTYRISTAKATALKEIASAQGRVSTHDAIAALMWRTLTVSRYKAGRLSADKTSTYTFPHNSRRHVGLPKDWVGNCCYFVSASLPVSQILEPNSLPVLAAAIRAGLNTVNKEVVGGIMELRKPCSYDITWWPLLEVNEPWILMMTSLYHSELFGVDFGDSLGRVKHFGTSDEGVMGGIRSVGLVGAKVDGGGCDVSLGLDGEEEAFVNDDEVWGKFVHEVGK
jgi:hypothetical protein